MINYSEAQGTGDAKSISVWITDKKNPPSIKEIMEIIKKEFPKASDDEIQIEPDDAGYIILLFCSDYHKK